MTASNSFFCLRRALGLFGILLIVATWSLWTGESTLPQIPWLRAVSTWPQIVDQITLAATLSCLLAFLLLPVRSKWLRPMGWLFVLALGTSLLLDQHRLQPWAWQFLLLGGTIAFSDNDETRAEGKLKWWRWLTASIYIYSAWSKCDASFLDSHGQLLIEGLFTPFNVSTEYWTPATKRWLSLSLPVCEMTVGLLLLFRRTYRVGCVGSWVMHVLLLLTLGPWGLNHEVGVLIWNTYFLFQNLCLFWWYQSPSEAASTSPSSTTRSEQIQGFLLTCVMTFALVTPILESFDRWDHWPAWAVYCSRPAQIEVLVAVEAQQRFPEKLHAYVGEPAPLADHAPFRLDAWSFQSRHCPLYPQARFKLALTLATFEQASLREEDLRVLIHSSPNRWTGQRVTTELNGMLELADHLDQFFINTQPRR